MLKLDFGSGHNPKQGYYSCDITGNPQLDFYCDPYTYEIYTVDKWGNPHFTNIPYFNEIHMRNVAHHIKDLKKLFTVFEKQLAYDGTLVVIDCNEEHYKQNLILDNIWYRYIIQRYEIYIHPVYRNIAKEAESAGFTQISQSVVNEKITMVFKRNV